MQSKVVLFIQISPRYHDCDILMEEVQLQRDGIQTGGGGGGVYIPYLYHTIYAT